MGLNNKWIAAIFCFLVAVICGLTALLFLKTNKPETKSREVTRVAPELNTSRNRIVAEAAKPTAKPHLPIEAKFVSIDGKNYLLLTQSQGAEFEGELAVKISKWNGSDSKYEGSTIRLIKKDANGIYFQTPPNPNVVPDYYAYRIHFPELYYSMASYAAGGRGYFWRIYATYLPGDTVQIENLLCEPIVLQCPLKVSERSDIKPDTQGKIDFVSK